MPTWIVAAIAGIIIVGGGGWYAASHAHRSAPVESGSAAPAAEGSFTGSIRELIARGGNYQCTMHTESGNVPTDGTIYVSGEHIRGDFTSDAPQVGKVDTHMIADGTALYLWNSLMPQGIKSTEVTEESDDANGSFDMNHSYTYECKAWSVDADKFAVPTDITFAAPGA